MGSLADFPSAEVLEAFANQATHLLPLPPIGLPSRAVSRSSRVRSRRFRKIAIATLAQDMVEVVNSLFGSLRPQAKTSREPFPNDRLKMA